MSRGWDWLRPCLGCDHLDDIGCAYLEHTGRRRPCPPGEGCTEYVPKKAKSRPPLPAWAPKERTRLTHRPVGRRAWKVEELLYRLKEEGFDFPGRMRDHVAEACKVSKSKLARLKVIREGLNTEWLTLWEGGKLPEETAYQVARQAADRSLEECFSAMDRSFSPHEGEVFAGYESGQTKLTGASDTPFGRKLLASDALALCQVADLLGVSLDYLLGRAEAPEISGGTAWRTGTPPRAGTYWTRIESDGTSADIPAEWDPACGWLLGVRDEDITVTGWVPLPA